MTRATFMSTFKPLPIALAVGGLLVVAAIGYRSLAPSDHESVAAPTGSEVTGASHAPSAGMHSSPDGASDPSNKVMLTDGMGMTLDVSRLFELGFAGGLVVDRDTRAVIEGVLNSMPEDPSAEDIQRLERTLREGLPKDDAERAIKLFSSYRGYTGDVRAQMESQGIPGNLQQMNAFFDQMDSLKRRHFDDTTAQALFGDADAHARASMEAMFVNQDGSLSLDEKRARLDALRAKLPPDQQSLIPQPTATEGAQSPP